MWWNKRATSAAATAGAEPCPTQPCGTCGLPMPIASFDQRCMRCRALVPAQSACSGGCSGCDLGKKPG